LEELIEGHPLRIERDLGDLSMAGGVRADLLVGGILRHPAAVSDLHVHDAWHPAKHVLHPPEAAGAEGCLLVGHVASSGGSMGPGYGSQVQLLTLHPSTRTRKDGR